MSDNITFTNDNGVFVATYEGRSGAIHVGAGDNRAETLRSLADSLDPYVEQ